jgi:hypothetical protein
MMSEDKNLTKKYQCTICNYETDNRKGFFQHKKTKKHLKNEKKRDFKELFVKNKKNIDNIKKVPVIEEKVPVTEEKVPVTEKKVPVTEKKVPVTEKKVPVTDFNEKEVPVTEKKVPVTEKKVPVTEKEVPVTEKKVPVTDFLEVPVTEKKVPVTEKKVPVTEKKVPVTEKKVPVTKKIYKCEDCHKIFKYKSGYYRHRKHRCIESAWIECTYCKKEYQRIAMLVKHKRNCSFKEEYYRQKEEEKKQEEKKREEQKQEEQINITNNTTNNTTTNNNNNITNNTYNDNRQVTFNITMYGQEDIAKLITDDIYEKLMLKNPEKSLGILMKHFYVDTKEHRNVLYTNPKHTHCKIYDGEKWILEDLNKVFLERITFINRNIMKSFNKRELYMIDNGITGNIEDEKEIKIDETIADLLMSKNMTKNDLEISKKSKTYKEELAYVNEQKRYKEEVNKTKREHFKDLYNISGEVKDNIKTII